MSNLSSLLQNLGVSTGGGSGPLPLPMQQMLSARSNPTVTKSGKTTAKPSATTTPTPTPASGSGQYTAQNPPPGFSSAQWAQLLNLAKTNTSIAGLVKQYTDSLGSGGGGTPAADQAWRRKMPTDTSQLLRQLSFNAGEMGMPGGYVGAVQLPAYGSTQPPVNNPDMTTYGQQPGIGEATFYQQSMKGGMAPIAAMSPLGVPAGWNPGGTGSSAQQQLQDYLDKLNSSGSGTGTGTSSGGKSGTPLYMRDPMSAMQKMARTFASGGVENPTSAINIMRSFGMQKMGLTPTGDPIEDMIQMGLKNGKVSADMAAAIRAQYPSPSGGSGSNNGNGSGNGGGGNGGGSNSNPYQPPGNGIPIPLPFGF